MNDSTKLTIADIKHLSKLSNIPLSDGEQKKLHGQLSDALTSISILTEIDTKKTVETSQVTGLENVMREDAVNTEQNLTVEKALGNAPKKHHNLFVTVGVFNDES